VKGKQSPNRFWLLVVMVIITLVEIVVVLLVKQGVIAVYWSTMGNSRSCSNSCSGCRGADTSTVVGPNTITNTITNNTTITITNTYTSIITSNTTMSTTCLITRQLYTLCTRKGSNLEIDLSIGGTAIA